VGQKALSGYLGRDRAAWRSHDACALIEDGARLEELLVDQGTDNGFLESKRTVSTVTLRDLTWLSTLPRGGALIRFELRTRCSQRGSARADSFCSYRRSLLRGSAIAARCYRKRPVSRVWK
jgi:hypothetical protein